MSTPIEGEITVSCGESFTMHYMVYNHQATEKLPLICAHGIANNSMDFDYLGRAIEGIKVISVDIVGRGKSGWLGDHSLYNYNTYCKSILQLAEHLNIKKFDYLGTSMGGIIGMFLAARFPQLVNRLVLNDIGPYIAERPLLGIVRYLTQIPMLSSLDQAREYLKDTLQGFGITKSEHWNHLLKHYIIEKAGKYTMAVDPKIGTALRDEVQRIKYMDIWTTWDRIKCDILVLRGEYSNILTSDIVNRMLSSGKKIGYIKYGTAGHAPALFEEDKIRDVERWLVHGLLPANK